MRIVIALGGNALLERGEKLDADIQRRHVRRAAPAIAPLAADHDLIICHGNGPQVGLLALESEADTSLTHPYPLDVLVAQTQGMIGYWLAQELRDAGIERPIATLMTQTVVAAEDPAFARPTKFIGAAYPEHRARVLARRHGWTIAQDGPYWRRVVASPKPVRVIEESPLHTLLDAHTVVICGGGGGAPVVEDGHRLEGVEAVVDKDAVAALLAVEVDADRLILLTDVAAVMRDFGTADARPIARATVGDLKGMAFPDGSMGPKVAACVEFTARTGRPSAIGRLADAAAVIAGTAGTTITT